MADVLTVSETGVAPFDTAKLDALMESEGLDLLIATSKHNVQYLLGGHRSSFFHFMDALGTSRYLPVFVYPRGRPDQAGYFGHKLERHDSDIRPFWTRHTTFAAFGVEDAVAEAVAHIGANGLPAGRIGIEDAFLPVSARDALAAALPAAEFPDALVPLERLRAIKSPWEIEQLHIASERVLEAMQATFAQIEAGMTKAEIIRILRIEEVKRDLTFEYCWLSVGPDLNRVASDQVVRPGDAISIDSGANYNGYVGDLARMAVVGEPDAELEEILAAVESVQTAAFAMTAPGRTGREIHAAAGAVVDALPWAAQTHFVAHGMGLISHEAPRLTSEGPIRYHGLDADAPLEPGMVVSVETTIAHPERGAVKLEDSLLITADGHTFLGEGARGWNRTGR